MDNIEIAKRIVELSGGKRNIVSNSVYKTELIIKVKKINKIFHSKNKQHHLLILNLYPKHVQLSIHLTNEH